MKKKLTIHLDEKVYKCLQDKFQGDKEAIDHFAGKAVEESLKNSGETKEKQDTRPGDLDEYLKMGNSGNRNYGAKGQGWWAFPFNRRKPHDTKA